MAHKSSIGVCHSCIRIISIVQLWYSKIPWGVHHYWIEVGSVWGHSKVVSKVYCIRKLFNAYVTGRWWHNSGTELLRSAEMYPTISGFEGKPGICVMFGDWPIFYVSLHNFLSFRRQILLLMGSNRFILFCGKISWRYVMTLTSLPRELHHKIFFKIITAYFLCWRVYGICVTKHDSDQNGPSQDHKVMDK